MCVTLVDELVEGVLSVGPRLAPHDWSGVVVDTGAIFGDVLPVGLHVALRTRTRVLTVSHNNRVYNTYIFHFISADNFIFTRVVVQIQQENKKKNVFHP